MVTIKFRGKRLDNEKWEYGDLMHDDRGGCYVFPVYAEGLYKEYKVTPETVGEFTGLKDKNGKEIYEGDILRIKEYENLLMKEFSEDSNRFDLFTLEEIEGEKIAEYVTQVKWEEGGFQVSTNSNYFDMWIACMFGDMKKSSPVFEFEVIGNIHDNPELIK